MNINRDYLIVLDVKTGKVDSPNIYYFNTDKNTSNIYVQMILRETSIEATTIENATDYSIKANIIKPDLDFNILDGILVNEEKAIYEFNLTEEYINLSGNYKIEFEVSSKVENIEESITSFPTKFKVFPSILTDTNKPIESSSDYPILKQLIEEVRELQANGGGGGTGTGSSGHTHSNKTVLDGITSTKVNHWDTAYTHSQITHFSGDYNDLTNKPTIPTSTSQLTNDSGFATETYVSNAIANAQLGSGGEVDLSGYVTKEIGNASQITFSDGQTFQEKLDTGILKGDRGEQGSKGDRGEQGPQGEKGDKGADGLTTSISLNGVTYTQENGVITLPNITSGGNTPTITQIEPQELDMPKVFFYGNALPTTKDNVNLTMDYISNTDKFSAYIKLKCQGTSSMSYAKKNFTVNMYSDEARTTKLKKDFKGWGEQSKFCLKANYVDTTHTRNLAGARIGYDIVKSRPDSTFKQQLLSAPRCGLVDGFPIKLYFNGEFYGIYTWNIPKDGWMFNMDENNPNHIVLCAEKNTDGNSSLINSCQFRQLWTNGDGNDWSVEFGTYSTDLQTKFNRVIAFVKDSTDEEFKANISQYLDLYSVIDYYCFSYLCCHLDGLAKNMLMVTYDGNIWGCSLYDMDSIFGVNWNGQSYVATNYQCPEQYQEQFSLLWPKIERCFGNELYQRYLELRRGALSLSNIIKHVEEIYDVIPDRVFADEKAKWTSLPQVNTNTMTRFRNYMRDRAAYVDAEMLAIGSNFPCTGIVLSADTLSFTTTDTQTLSVVVSPTNCTDTVTWSVSPTGVVSVDNGVVTPIANGSCTITATCGSYSDTCSVTVSLPNVECTGINLDQNTLALGGNSGTENPNLLSGVNSTISGGGNLEFDAITLEAGFYEISNINEGTFTWLGYTINGVKTEPKGGSTDSIAFLIEGTSDVIISAYADNKETNTADKLALYKSELGTPQQFTQAGNGYFDNKGNLVESTADVYSETISLDTTKRYIVKYIGSDTINGNYIVVKFNSNTVLNPKPLITGQIIKIIENASTLAISVNTSLCSLSDIQLIELNRAGKTLNKAQLTATVTPENCTQPVVWSVSPEGIVTVNNGLVTAVSNGEATVTATCGTQTAICAVTVSGMSESGNNLLKKNI